MSKGVLNIVKPGLHSLIQDGGRRGYFRLGITWGGPADRLSFLWANRLCGNSGDTTALEIILGNFEATLSEPAQIAVTGAEAPLQINGVPHTAWRSYNLEAGSRITIGPTIKGVRIYLAIRGGFTIKPEIGSTATVVRERLGGLSGDPLQAGDELPYERSADERTFYLPPARQPELWDNDALRIVPAWRSRQLPKALKKGFYSQEFSISADANRMGYRLTGEPLPDTDKIGDAMLSEGILQGTVQIPPQGLPIIMAWDHQTIGGYPKLGTIVTPDLWRLGQMRPGSGIRFQPVTLSGAQALLRHTLATYERTAPVPV